MIRYPIDQQALLDEVEREKPGWLDKADRRRDLALKPAKKFHTDPVPGAPAAPDWSDVKGVYRRLQGDKCAFCERDMPIGVGAGEHHIEHFRPKSRCQEWKPEKDVEVTHGPGRAEGYYWLAYDPWNYTASCYTCNTGEFKGDRFPIQGTKGRAHWGIGALDHNEKPLLIYPIGDRDSDPEDVIGWRGVVPMAKPGPEQDRGVVNIEFFGLARRPNLDRVRSWRIVAAWYHVAREHAARLAAEEDPDDAAKATALQAAKASVDQLLAGTTPHAACIRAFARLARSDFEEAERVLELVTALDDSLG